jgi:hypothetical protein
MVSADTNCFNGLQRCCLQHAVKPYKVLVSLASQAVEFESLSAILVPLRPQRFNPAFPSLYDPCTEEFPDIHKWPIHARMPIFYKIGKTVRHDQVYWNQNACLDVRKC